MAITPTHSMKCSAGKNRPRSGLTALSRLKNFRLLACTFANVSFHWLVSFAAASKYHDLARESHLRADRKPLGNRQLLFGRELEQDGPRTVRA